MAKAKKSAPLSKSVQKRIVVQTAPPRSKRSQARVEQAPILLALPKLPPLQFNQDLFYHWCEGPEWVAAKAGLVRSLLHAFSEKHGTFVVPGRQLWDYASMAKKQTGKMPTELLDGLLASYVLKPLQGP